MSYRVLIVEDDVDIRRNLILLLESDGYTVEQAGNGLDALNLLKASTELPAVIILDLSMPIMDGFQFRSEQQKVARIAAIPVIIMTADGRIEDKKTRTSANAALRKPVDIEDILSTVATFCHA